MTTRTNFVGGFLLAAASATSTAQAQELGAVAWGEDNCLYSWNGRNWSTDGTCRVFPFPDTFEVWDTYSSLDPQRLIELRVDERDPNWNYVWHVPEQAWMAHSKHDPTVMFALVDGVWMTADEIAAEIARIEAEMAAARAQSVQAVPPEGITTSLEQEGHLIEGGYRLEHNDHPSLWLAPDCTTSYNGC